LSVCTEREREREREGGREGGTEITKSVQLGAADEMGRVHSDLDVGVSRGTDPPEDSNIALVPEASCRWYAATRPPVF
jgi:hypothetical protein